MAPVRSVLAASLLLSLSTAFPFVANQLDTRSKKSLAKTECNTGIICSKNFDEKKQFVDVSSGSLHEFKAPAEGDIRGPCPGLNAAANHGFLPHSGVTSITRTISGLHEAYNMGFDLSSALAVIAVALTGDYLTESWSIGGPFPYNNVGGLLSPPEGISYSHNKYESDASVGRFDAYLNNGDAYSLSLDKFAQMYDVGNPEYSLYNLRQHFQQVREYSIHNNPYFFFAPFAGLVAPAAHEFVVNFMSNHSTERPSGYLDSETLKQFFAVTGPRSNFKWHPGYERIPENWYKRPGDNPYTAEKNLADTTLTASVYPGTLEFGGNMGKPNSFTGVDVADLTGGVYNGKDLLDSNNLGCFMFQFVEAVLPDELAGFVKHVQPVRKMLQKHLAPALANLECPKLGKFNQGLFNQFPGYHYHPKAPSTGGG